MTTNAQAALQAAATQFSGTAATVAPATLMGVAAQYHRWLDRADQAAQERNIRVAQERVYSKGGVVPAPLPSSAGHPDNVEKCPVGMCVLPKGHQGTTHPPIPLPQLFQRKP